MYSQQSYQGGYAEEPQQWDESEYSDLPPPPPVGEYGDLDYGYTETDNLQTYEGTYDDLDSLPPPPAFDGEYQTEY